MMLKSVLRAGVITISASLLTSTAYAQNHSDHQHSPDPSTQTSTPLAPDFVFTEAPEDHAIGGDFAPITMITYASVTCGHCGNWFSNIWPEVKTELVETDKIRFVLRPLPTAPAALSVTGFTMAECAPDADYMSVIEYQMENQKEILELAQAGQGQAAYAKIAKLAGLDDDAEITACLSDKNNSDHIALSNHRANAAGVSGVPAFFINGEEYKGDQSAKAIIKLINEMIETGSSSLPAAATENPDKIKITPPISTIGK
ncbi:MAG: thioredoxin domain-containing protein [Litorimonas sp.]